MATKQFIIILLLFLSSSDLRFSVSQTWIKAGYWLASSEFPLLEINSALFTHLICAFADVDSSTYQLSISSKNEPYVSRFTNIVRKKNPSITTLLSIWNGGNATSQSIFGHQVNYSVLSSMVRYSSSRMSFIESSIRTARLYGFQGIDLYWVWPNSTDLNNMGTFLDEWRAAIISEASNSGEPKLILTMSVRYVPTHETVSYPIDSMKKNLDWAHLVAYDYHLPSKANTSGPHSALYDPSSNISTDFGIREWFRRGFPANKLVLGLPYHGYAWTLVNPNEKSVGSHASGPAITSDGVVGYKRIRAFIQNSGYGAAAVYNATYAVNLFTSGAIWINFDAVESIQAKIAYAKKKKLIGYYVYQVADDDNWALSLAAKRESEDRQDKPRLMLIIIFIIVAISVMVLCTIICCLKRIVKPRGILSSIKSSLSKLKNKMSSTENLDRNANKLQVFSFTTIKKATNNFASENKIGEGGYGPVYKGRLPKGQEIAVKRLSRTSHQGLKEFKNEVELTSRLQHVNLVPVFGICTQNDEKILIYEYMQNKSLDFYVFDSNRSHLLDWRKRALIIEGVTQGLLYLQEYSNFTIVHRDLKVGNILLDKEMNPKISDFGMAKAFTKDECEANTGRIVGTYGCVPPEYVKKGIYSMKYDVYSYGVLILQIISGKRSACYYGYNENLNLLEYGYELWKAGEALEFFDSSLDDSSSPLKLIRCMQVALLCVQENPEDRPSMLKVYNMLISEGADIPTPKKPAFSAKRYEDDDSQCISKVNIFSVNDATISQLVPR